MIIGVGPAVGAVLKAVVIWAGAESVFDSSDERLGAVVSRVEEGAVERAVLGMVLGGATLDTGAVNAERVQLTLVRGRGALLPLLCLIWVGAPLFLLLWAQ